MRRCGCAVCCVLWTLIADRWRRIVGSREDRRWVVDGGQWTRTQVARSSCLIPGEPFKLRSADLGAGAFCVRCCVLSGCSWTVTVTGSSRRRRRLERRAIGAGAHLTLGSWSARSPAALYFLVSGSLRLALCVGPMHALQIAMTVTATVTALRSRDGRV